LTFNRSFKVKYIFSSSVPLHVLQLLSETFFRSLPYFRDICLRRLKWDTVYTSRQFASARDYQILITVKPMKFWIGAIDSLGSKCIIKMFLFFLYVSYERRYCNAKFESGNLLLRNVNVIIIINVIVARSCVVQLQFLTQEALAITFEYMYIIHSSLAR